VAGFAALAVKVPGDDESVGGIRQAHGGLRAAVAKGIQDKNWTIGGLALEIEFACGIVRRVAKAKASLLV